MTAPNPQPIFGSDIEAHVYAETQRCIKLICPRCERGEPVRWWPGAGGFWAHHDDHGYNHGNCLAGAIRGAPRGDLGKIARAALPTPEPPDA